MKFGHVIFEIREPIDRPILQSDDFPISAGEGERIYALYAASLHVGLTLVIYRAGLRAVD